MGGIGVVVEEGGEMSTGPEKGDQIRGVQEPGLQEETKEGLIRWATEGSIRHQTETLNHARGVHESLCPEKRISMEDCPGKQERI